MTRVSPLKDDGLTLGVRNRRTAWLLVGWIVFLCLVSVVVIWVRN